MPLKTEILELRVQKLEKDGIEAGKIIVADGWEVRHGVILRDQEEVFVVRQVKEVRIVQEVVSEISKL